MRLLLKMLTLSLILTTSLSAQPRTLVGRIFDAETLKPIENANVFIGDSDITTFSNRMGFFQLEVKPTMHKVLVISHVGYGSIMLPLPENDKFQVPLRKGFIMLPPLNLVNYPNTAEALTKDDELTLKKQGDVVIESDAGFVGGMQKFYSLVGNSLVTVPGIGENGFKFAFTINDKGRAVDFVFYDSAERHKSPVMTVFESMPDWKPATQRGKNVSQHFALSLIVAKSAMYQNFADYFRTNFKYPASFRRMGIEGLIVIEFEVDSSGAVGNISMLKDISKGESKAEAMRVIAGIPGAVKAEMRNPMKKTKFVLPVLLTLDGGDMSTKNISYQSEIDGAVVVLEQISIVALGVPRPRR